MGSKAAQHPVVDLSSLSERQFQHLLEKADDMGISREDIFPEELTDWQR